MSFKRNSFVTVTNPNLKSYGKVGLVINSGFVKTEVQLSNGFTIAFLNHNLEPYNAPAPEPVQHSSTSFRVGDVVRNRSNQEAKVIKVHDSQTGQYLNVELLGDKHPQVQTWRDEGITLVSRAVTTESSENPRKFKETVGKFILWSPQSSKPPKVIHTTLSAAREAQKSMAERYVHQEFYIMKAVSKVRMERKVELVPVEETY